MYTDRASADSCQESETGSLNQRAAVGDPAQASAETNEGADTVESYELDDLTTGFARIPTDVLDVAGGLGLQETSHLLLDSSAGDNETPVSNSGYPRYADVGLLSKFIPACDPYDKSARTCRVVMSRRRVMLSVQASLAFLVFLMNVAWTVWATKRHPTSAMIGNILTGNCTHIRNINIGLHLLLNGFSSLFLGAGNYCMQVVVAPTSSEVRAAHASGRYFDIGIHSMRNLQHITKYRRATWLGLGICSTLLHLM